VTAAHREENATAERFLRATEVTRNELSATSSRRAYAGWLDLVRGGTRRPTARNDRESGAPVVRQLHSLPRV
jgi:hypothetical protein